MTPGDRVRWDSPARGPLSRRRGQERYVRRGETGVVIESSNKYGTVYFTDIQWDNGFRSAVNKSDFLRYGGRLITILDLLVDEV